MMTHQMIKGLVEQKSYSEARESIQGMNLQELQSLHYWGFKLRKFIFCSAAADLLKEHFGMTPNYEICGGQISDYT